VVRREQCGSGAFDDARERELGDHGSIVFVDGGNDAALRPDRF
jgi:hypothetical protein